MSYLYLGTIGLLTTFFVSALVSGVRYKLGKHHPANLPKFVLFRPLDNLFERSPEAAQSSDEIPLLLAKNS